MSVMKAVYRFYQHPKCGTCRKAAKWLADQGIEVEWVDIREQPPTKDELRVLLEYLGSRSKLLNTSGMDYRSMGLKDKLPDMTDAEVITLLNSNGMLVKRPFLVGTDSGLTGFKAEEWTGFFKQ